MKILTSRCVLIVISQASSQAGIAVSVAHSTDKDCTDCLNFVADVDAKLSSNATINNVEQFLDVLVCTQLGPLTDMCKQLVAQFVPQYLKQLSQIINSKQVCGLLGMCSSDIMHFQQFVRRPLTSDLECTMCKTLVEKARAMDRDPAIQAEIKNFVENSVCGLIGKASECKTFVEGYAPILFELIANELDGTVLCETFGLCAKPVPISRLGLSSAPVKVKETKKVDKSNGATCSICEFFITELEQQLGDNRTEAAIEAALERVCSFLPQTVRAECDTFVETYGAMILKLLVQELPPKSVCTTLGLCTAVQVKPVAVTEGPGCEICEFVLTIVDSLISNNKSQAEVEQALKQVCDMMPVTIEEECKQFVDLYGPAVINLLVNKLDPKVVCKTLRLCTSSNSFIAPTVLMEKTKKLSAGPACIVCEFLVKELGTLLKDNATETEIENALDKACALLPDTLRQQCVDIVNTYAPAIIEYILQDASPEVICSNIGLCINSVKKIVVKPSALKVKGSMCSVCISALTAADAMLKENSTVEEILHVLENICTRLPVEVGSQCKAFVDEYTGLLVLEVATNLDPKKVCTTIQLCDAALADKVMKNLQLKKNFLGQKECTYGPAYWCASMDNAIKCKTVEHCKKHAWN